MRKKGAAGTEIMRGDIIDERINVSLTNDRAPCPRPPLTRGLSPKVTGGERMKEYNKTNIPLAKNLRKNMTPWERKLWYEFLRNSPIRFQR